METVVVTRHPALVEYLRERGIVGTECRVITHATEPEIRGKVVVGVLPLALAALAEELVVVDLNLPQELRGQELSLDQVRQYAGNISRYKVTKVG